MAFYQPARYQKPVAGALLLALLALPPALAALGHEFYIGFAMCEPLAIRVFVTISESTYEFSSGDLRKYIDDWSCARLMRKRTNRRGWHNINA